MLLDHDFGWDDGLICGGSVNGVILPHAAQAKNLWHELASSTAPIRWGVKEDFSIAAVENNPGFQDSLPERGCVEDQPQQHEIPKNAAAGAPSPVTQPRSGSDWLYTETVSPPVE